MNVCGLIRPSFHLCPNSQNGQNKCFWALPAFSPIVSEQPKWAKRRFWGHIQAFPLAPMSRDMAQTSRDVSLMSRDMSHLSADMSQMSQMTIAFDKCPPLLGRNQWLPMLSTGTKSEMAHVWA